MFSFIRQSYQEWARSGTRAGARPDTVRHLACEALEDRMLLSLTGAQLFATSLPVADHAVVASSPGGRSVVAWQTANSSTDRDIKAQIFDAAGHKLGGVLTVAGGRENQYAPTVAVNASGAFVVAWTVDFSRTDKDIHATLFRADGSRVKSDVDVATTFKAEYAPTAGIDARGNFVVSYTFQFNGADTDVKAALFNASANPVRTVDVATSSEAEANTGIAVASNGSFAVSYTTAGTHMVRHFSAAGQPLDAGKPTPQPTPPPVPKPPPPAPHPVPTLSGTVAGGYAGASAGTGKGTRFDLVAIGSLTGTGEVTVTGDLLSTGSARSSTATGVLVLHGAQGTITLAIVGPSQAALAALPSQFHFSVTSATGAYSRLHASGTLNVHLIPANHTLTLGLFPLAI